MRSRPNTMAGRLPQIPSKDPTQFCRLCFSKTGMHWVIRTNGTEVDQPFVNTIGECLGVWLSLSDDFPCAVCRECTTQLDQIRKMREQARKCDVALRQKRREDPGGQVLFYDYPEDRVWMNGTARPECYQDDSDFENEPILPEVMLNETSEEIVQLPKTTRLTQSEKKLALEGYFEMYTAWKESIATTRDDDELTEEAPEAVTEERFGRVVHKKEEAYRVRYREQQPIKTMSSAKPNKSASWCSVCRLELRTVDRYLTHMYEKHLPGGNSCNECNQSFSTPGGLKRHMQRHKNDLLLSCDKCSLQFVNENELRGHRTTDGCRQAADQIYGKCQYCDRTFSRQGRYIFHLKRLHPDKPLPIQAVERRKSTAGRIEFRRKSAPPARSSPVPAIEQPKRSTIPQGFTDWRYRTGVGRTTIEKGRFLVILNRLSEEQIESYRDPMPLKTVAGFHFVCIRCYGEFPDLDHFNDHLDRCRQMNGGDDNWVGPPPMVKCECDVCASIYQQVDCFVEHLQQHERPYEVKPHECPHCMRRNSKSRQRSRALSRCSDKR